MFGFFDNWGCKRSQLICVLCHIYLFIFIFAKGRQFIRFLLRFSQELASPHLSWTEVTGTTNKIYIFRPPSTIMVLFYSSVILDQCGRIDVRGPKILDRGAADWKVMQKEKNKETWDLPFLMIWDKEKSNFGYHLKDLREKERVRSEFLRSRGRG